MRRSCALKIRTSSVIQVLRVINPKVTYTPKPTKGKPLTQSSVTGVAVWLKGFLKLLDRCDIPHPSEVDIRKQLRGRHACDTRMKQYFHTKKAEGVTVARQHKVCRPCVCVPREDIPEEFFATLYG